MAYPHKDEMIWVGGRWWWFPGRQISVESQFEWKNGRAYLLESDGSAVEGILFIGEIATELRIRADGKRKPNMHRAKLLDRRATLLTVSDIPVRTDVFIHNLDAFTLEAMRRAVAQGLRPSGVDFTEDDDSIAIRFTRPRF